MRKNPVIVVEENQIDRFEANCARYIDEGYKLSSSSCGFVNSERYDFVNVYQAIFVKETL